MKYEELEEVECSAAGMARLLGVTERRVNQLIGQEVVVKLGRGRVAVVASVKNYIAYTQTQGGDGGEADPRAQSARLMKARAEAQELKNSMDRDEVRNMDEFLMINDQIANVIIRGITAIPGRMTAKIAAATGADAQKVRDLLNAEIDGIRSDMARSFERYAAGVDDLDEA